MYFAKSIKLMQKTKSNTVSLFVITLTLLLGGAFVLHGYIQHILGIGFFEMQIVTTYVFNYILTGLAFFALIYYKNKKSNQLGFIFLFSSLLKFILFFVLIFPGIKASGSLRGAEFAAFFVPYSIGLFMEIFKIVRLLNRE